MKKLALLISATLLTSAAGCQKDDKAVNDKLDKIAAGLTELKADVAALKQAGVGAGRGQQPGQQRPQRPSADPAKTYAVPIEGDPFIGPADAKITIVKGYEFACPFCDKVRPTTDQVMKDYPGDVRIVYKQFVVHPQVATTPSLAVCAGHKQGKFKEMEEALWEKAFKARKFDEENMKAIAKEIGLDLPRFEADMKGDCVQFIAKDQSELQKFGVGATPAFFINGRFLSGAQPLPAFKAVIDEELKKANERIAAGTSKESYYKTWVLEKGLKALEAPAAAPGGAPGGQPPVRVVPAPGAPGAAPAPGVKPAPVVEKPAGH